MRFYLIPIFLFLFGCGSVTPAGFGDSTDSDSVGSDTGEPVDEGSSADVPEDTGAPEDTGTSEDLGSAEDSGASDTSSGVDTPSLDDLNSDDVTSSDTGVSEDVGSGTGCMIRLAAGVQTSSWVGLKKSNLQKSPP